MNICRVGVERAAGHRHRIRITVKRDAATIEEVLTEEEAAELHRKLGQVLRRR